MKSGCVYSTVVESLQSRGIDVQQGRASVILLKCLKPWPFSPSIQ